MQTIRKTTAFFAAGVLAALVMAGCGGKNKNQARGADTSAEPDKVLYERAMDDMKHGRMSVARFALQTLLNTYPDSEYLAKAKLAIADSFYKEGDTASLKQAISEYKDFDTFFPYLDEAAYAQMQVGMAHYRMMEKPDRDRSEAQMAEQEFQTFLLKYPKDKLADQAAQRLREIQEVLAQGDYAVGQFYFKRGSYRASTARLNEVVDRYPLYSRADEALWMLAQSYERFEKSEYAARYYTRLARGYPASARYEDAKKRLAKLGYPVPQPDADSLARVQKEHEFDRQRPGLLKRSLGIVKSGPDVSRAAHTGAPDLTPAGEPAGTETLQPGGQTTLVGGAAGTGGGASGSAVNASGSTSGPVQTVAAGPPGPEGQPTATTGNSSAEDPTGTDAASSDQAAANDPNSLLPNHQDPNAKKSADKAKESTSKKKKGLRKLIPF